jgi:ABC-type transport system involved in multi-copper enzyme maturation permease subunit
MNGTLAVVRYTLIELSRRRILLVFFIIGALGIVALGVGLKILYAVAISNGSIAPSNVDPSAFNRFLEVAFVSYIFQVLAVFGLLIAYAIGMTAIYHDLDSGAAISIFSKPVSRLAFTTGKVAAAVAALGVLAIEARLVMFLFGGGLEGALTGEVLAVVANSVVVMLIVLSLSTWMNNIVAAVVTFVYYNVITGVISFVHNLADNGVITNNVVKTIFDIAWWLVPHELISTAVGDVARASVSISGPQSSNQAIAGIPPASGPADIAWWAFVVIVFAGLVYYAVRRRQV